MWKLPVTIPIMTTRPIPFPAYAPTCDLAELVAQVIRHTHRAIRIPRKRAA